MNIKSRQCIRLYIVLNTLYWTLGFSLQSAIYSNYLLGHGLSLFEMNLVNVSFYVTLFIFEIPTGSFADVFGRKLSFVVASACVAVGALIYGWSNTAGGFVLAEVCIAIGSTFASGAFQAWLVDSLHHYGSTEPLKKIFAKAYWWRKAGAVIGVLVGSYIAVLWNMSISFFIGGVCTAVVSVIAYLLMDEVYFKRAKFGIRDGVLNMYETTRISIKYGLSNVAIRHIFLVSAVQCITYMPINMMWQPWFTDKNLSATDLGYIMSLSMICSMVGSQIVQRTVHLAWSEAKLILIIQLYIGMCIILMSCFDVAGSLLWFFAHQVGRGCYDPIKDAYLHDNIQGRDRATVVSFESIIHHIAGAIGLILSGLTAQYLGIQATWILFGGFMCIGTLAIFYSRR